MKTPPVCHNAAVRPKNRGWKIAAGAGISLFFLGLTFYNIDLAKLWAAFARVRWPWIAAAALLVVASYVLRGLLWRQILHRRPPARLWNLFRIITIGYLANNLLPLKLGEVIRAWLLGKRENLSFSQAVGTVVAERGSDLFALLSYFGLMMLFVPYEGWLRVSGLILFGALVGFALVVAMNYWFAGHWLERMEAPLQRLHPRAGAWLHGQLEKFSEGLKLIQSPWQLAGILALALATWLTWTLVVFLCFRAFGLELPLGAALFVMVVLNFGLMLPSSPGGLGVFEFMFILALKPYGVDKEAALGVGFGMHMLQYLITLILGWVFAVQMNFSMSSAYSLAPGESGNKAEAA